MFNAKVREHFLSYFANCFVKLCTFYPQDTQISKLHGYFINKLFFEDGNCQNSDITP